MQVRYVDRREDRVVVYASASPDVREFKYRIKAVNRGKVIVPPPFGESMYDREIQYIGTAKSFTIE
jgi:uncharacterized protein YfaS (alpha-2-macroglobulin family)